MFMNNIVIAWRNLNRQKVFSAINIFGFAIGLAVCLIITFYVVEDLTFDCFHRDSRDIYRVLTLDTTRSEETLIYGITSGPLMANMQQSVPEVLAATRVARYDWAPIWLPETGEPEGEDQRLRVITLFADDQFFDVFSFEVLEGEKEHPLQDPMGLYLTPERAAALFGEEDPIGRDVLIGDLEGYHVAGLVREPPSNSSIRFECLIPFRVELSPVWWDSWINVALTGYIKLQPGSDWREIEGKIEQYADDNGFARIWKPRLQPLPDIHLNSNHLRFDVLNFNRNDKSTVYAMAVIAALVLLIASFNFINLSSARAAKRAREAGLRKVIGGRRRQLIQQFLTESTIITLIAMLIAYAIFSSVIPAINENLHRETDPEMMHHPFIILILLAVTLIIGLLAGIYPALVISSFQPIAVLKGNFHTSPRGLVMRRILVVGQFAISIALITAVLVVHQQIQYMNEVDLGYSRENVVLIFNQNEETANIFQERIRNLPGVDYLGGSNSLPGGTLTRFQVVPEHRDTEEGGMFDRLIVDEDLASAIRLEIMAGRNFSQDNPADDLEAVILNETAVHFAGWEEAVGRTVTIHREDHTSEQRTVIGVVKDFNFTTFRNRVNPMFIVYDRDTMPIWFIRLDGRNNAETLTGIENIHNELNPDIPFHYEYFSDFFDRQFQRERGLVNSIGIFSLLAILISCLGLLGLSAYMAEQRTKEIGIRKVMGSTVSRIVLLLTGDFIKWVFLANFLAWPLAWYALQRWLQSFVYRIPLQPSVFLVSGIIVIIIAVLSVSFQTVRAAATNPINALKYE